MLNEVLHYVKNVVVWCVEPMGRRGGQKPIDRVQDQHQHKEGTLGIKILLFLLQKGNVSFKISALLLCQLQNQTIVAQKLVAVQKIFGDLFYKLIVKIDAMAGVPLVLGVGGVYVMIGSRTVQDQRGRGYFAAVSVIEKGSP